MFAALTDVTKFGMPAFMTAMFLALILAREAGWLVGAWHRRRLGGKEESVGLIVSSILALLAFVLGFNLSMASGRLEERRLDTLSSANAIGTAWLQANAVGGPHGEAIADLMEDFLVARIDFVAADLGSQQLYSARDETARTQKLVWSHATELVRIQPSPVTASLMNAINEAFDAAMATQFAVSSNVPRQFVHLLLAMTVIGMAAVGFHFGFNGQAHRLLGVLLAALWVLVLTAILDVGYARLGDLRTQTTAYEWTLESMRSP